MIFIKKESSIKHENISNETEPDPKPDFQPGARQRYAFYGIRDLPQQKRNATPEDNIQEQQNKQKIVDKIATKAVAEMTKEKVQ